MRIIWNHVDSYFQAELQRGEHWLATIELIKKSGFKTSGPPEWIWHTSKASVLNKLRDLKPPTGLVITEIALEKYKQFNEQEQKKLELKKILDKANKAAKNNCVKRDTYTDQNGIVCFVVEPLAEKFVSKYVPPRAPDVYCFLCGEPVYYYEADDCCMWCEEKFGNSLTPKG